VPSSLLGGWQNDVVDRLLDAETAEFDEARRSIPLQARLGRLLRHGQTSADGKAAGLSRQLTE
jgi:hypothetical protein